MDKALLLADWKGFPARRERSKREGKLRGIGIATFLEASAAGVAPKDQAYARFDASGILHVSCVSQSTGQGHETAFVRILSEGLGVTGERIRIHEGNLDMTVVGNGTGGSRSLYGAGSAVKLLVAKLIETAKPLAAEALGVDAVQYEDGKFKTGGKSIAFFELAKKLAASSPHPMDCVAEGSFGATFPNGCHIAEVEIDPETGVVDVVGTRPWTTSATWSITPASKARCTAACCREWGRCSPSTRSTTPTPRSCSRAASWTTRCRAPTGCPPSAATSTPCPPRRTRSEQKA